MEAKLILKEFIYECEVRKYSKRTNKSYKNNVELFLNYIDKQLAIKELDNITSQHIKMYISYLYKKDRKETYINSILKSFRAFFKYCFAEDYIKINPTEKVHWAKEKTTIINTFSNEEVKRMLEVYKWDNYLNARNKTIIAMLFDTGVRCSELCDILISDIRDNYISVRGKGKKERYVAITPILQKHLIKYERFKSFYFEDHNIKYNNYFLSRTGRPLTKEAVERIVRYAGIEGDIRAEIRCSPHTCRHFFAQAQLINSLDVYSLSRILGHENITITKRYLLGLQDSEILKMSIKTSPLMNL